VESLDKADPKNIRVVLADDVEDIRLLVRVSLERDGRFQVVGEASDGAEAIRLAQDQRPDALVLDLAMPVMDGLEAIPRVRNESPTTKIVVLSAFEDSTPTTVLGLGAHAYVDKVANLDEVVDTLIDLCEADAN
jgi:DNA-binding NarL/FixJ family response regulator